MVKQKYIDILLKQKDELLEQKNKLGFFGKLFFRNYTDWVLTDTVKIIDKYWSPDGVTKVGEPYGSFEVQVEIRMRLSNGEIEINKKRI